MHIKQSFWQETNIQTILNIFTGKMAEQLSHATPEVIENFNRHIHHIFRRWYFLSLSPTKESSAADMLEYYKTIEKWPKNGQFLIRPQLVQQETNVTIELDIDYISFAQQPILQDIRRTLSGKKVDLFFPHDKIYQDLVQRIIKVLYALDIKTLGEKEFTLQELQAVWSATITALCSMWMEFDPFIGNRFTLKEFIKLWEGFLKDALDQDVVIDDVMDTIVIAVREEYPGWAYTIDELQEQEKKKKRPDKMQGTTFFTLGICLDRYFLTPLSTYLLLIRIHYTNLTCWEKDIEEALSHPKADIHYLFSDPCSAFRLTNFGDILVKGVIQK
jgi:hypothetical protein